jgi:hypothetical protein
VPVTTGTLMMMTLAGRFWDHVTRVTCQGNQDSPLAYCLHEQSPVGPNENGRKVHRPKEEEEEEELFVFSGYYRGTQGARC